MIKKRSRLRKKTAKPSQVFIAIDFANGSSISGYASYSVKGITTIYSLPRETKQALQKIKKANYKAEMEVWFDSAGNKCGDTVTIYEPHTFKVAKIVTVA